MLSPNSVDISGPKPLPFQAQCLSKIDSFHGRVLLSLEMGLGKTLVSLWWLKQNLDERTPAIIVCPASVKFNWQREAARLGVNVEVLETRRSRTPRLPVVVINYDILPYWTEQLQAFKARCIIIDECQFIKEPTSKRSRAVRLLAQQCRYILGLSGTPLLNRPIELFPILNLVRPDQFAKRRVFAWRYCKPRWTPWGWDYSGADRLDELHERLLRLCMIRYRKEEVLTELPQKIRSVVPLPLSNPNEYMTAERDFIRWLREQDPSAAIRARRAEEIVRIGYLLRLCAQLKLPAVTKWIQDSLDTSDGKLVVFARHRMIVNELSKLFPSVVIDGSTSTSMRQQVIDRFQSDSSIRVLIGNIYAAGVGINLTAANRVVFVEMAWRPSDHIQAEDRCHRIGACKTVWCYYLVAKDTIEERLCRIIQRKQGLVNEVLDGTTALDLLLSDLWQT